MIHHAPNSEDANDGALKVFCFKGKISVSLSEFTAKVLVMHVTGLQ